jgi:hypothetical protein
MRTNFNRGSGKFGLHCEPDIGLAHACYAFKTEKRAPRYAELRGFTAKIYRPEKTTAKSLCARRAVILFF